LLADYQMAKILRLTGDSYLILVDATKGMHTADEPKTVAVALLTEQLQEWYDYLKGQNVKIKYDYKPRNGGPHDGFVVVDPEGYLLEFELFKNHRENERFIPLLNQSPLVTAQSSTVPAGLGFKATITWLYYKDMVGMQQFYEEKLGLEQVVDQGWAKIYRASKTGYVGLVDERRGMHSFTDTKAVNISFLIDDIDGWFQYAKEHNSFELRSQEVSAGPETKYRAFVGVDPEGYYMEFDKFYLHADNQELGRYLELTKF
ncbi:MAG TPA: VOC family protein, partial [Cyclobacteriaceae bacterium]|nr:VOC family protein [Cyclobacteriaceae bacterium]